MVKLFVKNGVKTSAAGSFTIMAMTESQYVCLNCTMSISEPVHVLFNNSVINQCFPNKWKKANVIPVHIKGGKQIKNLTDQCHSCFICSKILEKIIFDLLF